MKPEVIITRDGSHTLFLSEMNEQYHSLNGAITESKHVYIENGFNFSTIQNPVVFEVGFGTGLNALLTALEAEKAKKSCLFYTIEKYPLDINLTESLNYGQIISNEAQSIFHKLHKAKWNQPISLNKYFTLHKINDDLTTYDFPNLNSFDIIYYDAFGPDKQPEMWTNAIFKKIADQTSNEGILVTYSAKGEVRRALNHVGFQMERLPGPPGKKQMLRGIKRESFI